MVTSTFLPFVLPVTVLARGLYILKERQSQHSLFNPPLWFLYLKLVCEGGQGG